MSFFTKFSAEKTWFRVLIAISIALSLIFITTIYFQFLSWKSNQSIYSGVLDTVKYVSLVEAFKKLDIDDNGLLTLQEFLGSEKYYRISEIDNLKTHDTFQSFPDLPVEPLDQLITVQAHFEPLNLKSLSKEINGFNEEPNGPLSGLLSWSQPFKKSHNFSSKAFSIFLPPSEKPLIPGTTWWIVNTGDDNYLSSNRHWPLQVEERLRPLFALLCLFHKRPFLQTRFGPRGTLAVLRAVGGDFLDIILRIHAEFQLNEPPLLPFWFTPAQFSGRIIISKDGSMVHYFHLEVPTHKNLNVDMEWLNGPSEENMEVDIGYVPLMMLSTNVNESAFDVIKNLCGTINNINSLVCQSPSSVLSVKEALEIIEQTFYPFKKVRYHNLTDAFEIAAAESKLVHGVLLWGALDDQSC